MLLIKNAIDRKKNYYKMVLFENAIEQKRDL